MPDSSDVEQSLAAAIAGSLYPGEPGSVCVVATDCRVYRGWPVVNALEADLVAGVAHVTVQGMGETTDTTRYSSEWQGVASVCPLSVNTSGAVVVFSGEAGPGVVAGVLVDGRAYAWRAQSASTAGVVAAVIADLVRVDRPAELSGTAVTFPAGRGVVGRAVSDGQGGRELRRQRRMFRVTLWCPSVESRDHIAAFVDLALSGAAFLDVMGWGCRVQATGGVSEDAGGAAHAYRRDLFYHIEYPTVLEESLPAMLFGAGSVNGAAYAG